MERFRGYFPEIPWRDDLTQRELDALTYRSRGLTDDQVGTALGISQETVKSRLKTARYKLRAKNTTHACCEAIRRGLIR